MGEANARREMRKRVLGYGIAGAATAALVWVGFVYEADPDLMTMVSSVEMQLGLAGTIADGAGGLRNADGDVVPAVATLLDGAKRDLERLEQAYPGLAASSFCRGNLAYLEGRYDDAAQHYARVRSLRGCDGELGDRSVINEAAALRRAGRTPEAETLLRTYRFAEARAAQRPREAATTPDGGAVRAEPDPTGHPASPK